MEGPSVDTLPVARVGVGAAALEEACTGVVGEA